MNKMLKHSNGFGLIEVVIGAAIITVFLAAAINVFATSHRLESELIRKIEAQYLAEEGIEVARFLRDSSWNASITPLTLSTGYYLDFNGSVWRATSTPSLVGGIFERKVTFSTGYRDGNNDIAESGIADDDLRKVTVSVAWPVRGSTTTLNLVTYLTNLFDN